MGKHGALSDGVMNNILLSYTYVAIWIFLSFTVIVYNKYILDTNLYNWPFPISLTMIHMAFCSLLASAAVRLLWLSNSAYIYLSVSFIQMLKALMPVAVYSIGILLKKDSFKSHTMLNMLAISAGVAIAAYGEAKYDSWGVLLQLGAVIFEATRLVLIQILLTSKGINLNPITSLYYVAPSCFVFLSIPWLFVEFPVLRRQISGFEFDFLVFGSNCVCAFALNLAVFLLVGKTSALTMNVAGVVKDWLLIAFSWSVIKDTVNALNLFGYGLAFLGVGYYNRAKLQALKEKEAQRRLQTTAAEEEEEEEAGQLLDGGGKGRRGESQA